MELYFYTFYKAETEFNWDFCSLEASVCTVKTCERVYPLHSHTA